jgi:hypothetical protein
MWKEKLIKSWNFLQKLLQTKYFHEFFEILYIKFIYDKWRVSRSYVFFQRYYHNMKSQHQQNFCKAFLIGTRGPLSTWPAVKEWEYRQFFTIKALCHHTKNFTFLENVAMYGLALQLRIRSMTLAILRFIVVFVHAFGNPTKVFLLTPLQFDPYNISTRLALS